MTSRALNALPAWKALKDRVRALNRPENHLKYLLKDKNRLENYSRSGGGLFFDFSRQRLDDRTLGLLHELADARRLPETFRRMTEGEAVNVTENRPALHTACRSFSSTPIFVNGRDVAADIRRVRDEIKAFAEEIHAGKHVGSTGKPFRHIVVVGIGGSYLGAQFVSAALEAEGDKGLAIHYLSNVDIHDFGRIAAAIDPESALWIIVSKSYATSETLANTRQAYAFMEEKGLDPARHFVTVTSKGSPGDDPGNPVLKTFHMFDFIGGRFSVTSAVGGVPLSLYLGYDAFERFLKGAEEMDDHARTAPVTENLPMLAALIGVWNNNFLGYPAQGIIPYASPLRKLAPHVQQLYMESNGKSVTADGRPLDEQTGTIIFGEPGTNAQHSFFQLAHQGRPFPIDFIGVINPGYPQYRGTSKGVTNHQELWANLMAQASALAEGREVEDPARSFPGNRPSSTLLIEDLGPENIGRLLAFYEARTVFEAFAWGVNPFDQFGVELGKTLAGNLRKEMAARNGNAPRDAERPPDPISGFYMDVLFSGKLPQR